jgi:3-oxoacyl-[acyl-carrier protein] reductase
MRVLSTFLRTITAPDAPEPQPGGLAHEADLRDATVPARLFDLAEAELGPVDVVVNNATGAVQDTFRPETRDRFGRAMQPVSAATVDQNLGVDARAGALTIAELARRHAERGATWGRIVGLTSGGPDGFPEEVSYGAAKGALERYTLAAATELASFGITANMVYPPVTDTGWVTDAVRRELERSPSPVRVARPEEVAEVIVYLCSDAARLVTGNVVRLR